MKTKHTLIALMEDRPGVMNRVVSLFRRRGFNIESLSVGMSEIPNISRMTVVVVGTSEIVEQAIKQLYKIVNVLKVIKAPEEQSVIRELALIKVSTNQNTRAEIMQIVDIFRAKIVDVGPTSMIIEATGSENKVSSLIQLLQRFGIKEIACTGRVVMVRGASSSGKSDSE